MEPLNYVLLVQLSVRVLLVTTMGLQVSQSLVLLVHQELCRQEVNHVSLLLLTVLLLNLQTKLNVILAVRTILSIPLLSNVSHALESQTVQLVSTMHHLESN